MATTTILSAAIEDVYTSLAMYKYTARVIVGLDHNRAC